MTNTPKPRPNPAIDIHDTLEWIEMDLDDDLPDDDYTMTLDVGNWEWDEKTGRLVDGRTGEPIVKRDADGKMILD